MGKDFEQLMSALNRLDTSLDVQWGRVGLMQRWLEDHSGRLERLSARVEASLARLDSLLKGTARP